MDMHVNVNVAVDIEVDMEMDVDMDSDIGYRIGGLCRIFIEFTLALSNKYLKALPIR
jgi:hypothetical protein